MTYNEQKIIKLLRSHFRHNNVIRMSGNKRRGIPDTVINISGYAFFLEIKIDKTELSAPQRLFLKDFKNSSGVLIVQNKKKHVNYYGSELFYNFLILNFNKIFPDWTLLKVLNE